MPHEQMLSTWKPQQCGMSAFQQLPQISGGNMRILSSPRAVIITMVYFQSDDGVTLELCCKGMARPEFRIFCGDIWLSSSYIRVLRGYQEATGERWYFLSVYEKFKKRQPQIWVRMKFSQYQMTLAPSWLEKEYYFFTGGGGGLGRVEGEAIYLQGSFIWTARCPVHRSNPTLSVSSKIGAGGCSDVWGRAPVISGGKSQCAQKGTHFHMENKLKIISSWGKVNWIAIKF